MFNDSIVIFKGLMWEDVGRCVIVKSVNPNNTKHIKYIKIYILSHI